MRPRRRNLRACSCWTSFEAAASGAGWLAALPLDLPPLQGRLRSGKGAKLGGIAGGCEGARIPEPRGLAWVNIALLFVPFLVFFPSPQVVFLKFGLI